MACRLAKAAIVISPRTNTIHFCVIEIVEYYSLSGVTVEAVQSPVNPFLT